MTDDATIREAAGRVLPQLARFSTLTVAASLSPSGEHDVRSKEFMEATDGLVAALVNLVKAGQA